MFFCKELQISVYCICLSLLAAQSSTGQSLMPDTVFLRKATEKIEVRYFSAMGSGEPVYQGREHIPHSKNVRGHPYFGTGQYKTADIIYDGIIYHHLKLTYDLVRDKAVLLDFDGAYPIELSTEKVRSFTVEGHHFIRPDGDSNWRGLVDTGFYELLYDGPSRLLAKRWKTLVYRPGDEPDYAFVDGNRLYLFDGKRFRPISNKKDLLRVFGGKEKEIKLFIKNQHLDMTERKEASIAECAAYFDSLKL